MNRGVFVNNSTPITATMTTTTTLNAPSVIVAGPTTTTTTAMISVRQPDGTTRSWIASKNDTNDNNTSNNNNNNNNQSCTDFDVEKQPSKRSNIYDCNNNNNNNNNNKMDSNSNTNNSTTTATTTTTKQDKEEKEPANEVSSSSSSSPKKSASAVDLDNDDVLVASLDNNKNNNVNINDDSSPSVTTNSITTSTIATTTATTTTQEDDDWSISQFLKYESPAKDNEYLQRMKAKNMKRNNHMASLASKTTTTLIGIPPRTPSKQVPLPEESTTTAVNEQVHYMTIPEVDDAESSTAVDLHEEEDVSSEEKKQEEQLACVKESSKTAAVVSSPPVDNISIDNDSVSVTSDISTATTRKKKAATHNDKLKVFKTEKDYYEQLEMIMSDEGVLDKQGRNRHPRIPNHGVRVFDGNPYMFAIRSGKEMLDAAPSKRVAICGATYDALVDGVLPSCARDGTIRGDKNCNNGYPIVYKGKDHDFNPVDNAADFAIVMNSFCNFKSKSTWNPKEEEEPSALFTYWNTVGAFGRTTKQVEVKNWKKILSDDELKTATWKVVLSKLHELESVPPATAVTSSVASIPSAPSNQWQEALERQQDKFLQDNKDQRTAFERMQDKQFQEMARQREESRQEMEAQRAANERSQALLQDKQFQEMARQREESRQEMEAQRVSNERIQAQQLESNERTTAMFTAAIADLAAQAFAQQHQPPQQPTAAVIPERHQPPQQPAVAVIPEQGRATKARGPPPAVTPRKRHAHLILDVDTPIRCTGGKHKGKKGIITSHTPTKYRVKYENGTETTVIPDFAQRRLSTEST